MGTPSSSAVHRSSRRRATICDNPRVPSHRTRGQRGHGRVDRQETAVHLSRRIAITGPAVVIAVLIPAAVAVAAPTHPPDPASTARAIAGDRAAPFRAVRPIAPAVASTRAALPSPDGPTWATARAIARHQVASFGPVRPTAPTALPDSTALPHPASA